MNPTDLQSRTEASAPASVDLKSTSLYLNQELSLLDFNERVLAQTKDEGVPLLERLRFLCISCTNLDEFFEIRVAGLEEQVAMGALTGGPDGMSVGEVLKAVRARARGLVEDQYRVLQQVLLPELLKQGIACLSSEHWSASQDAWLQRYFMEELLPVLSPIGLDPAHPFPRILNKSLNFIVALRGKDAFGRKSGLAVLQVPRALPRVIHLPPVDGGNGPHDLVLLSSVIQAHVDRLFPGMTVDACYQFRVTRNSELFVEEEEIDDLLRALEGELMSRRYGEEVRLEVAHDCRDDLVQYLLDRFSLLRDDLYPVDGPVNLNRLEAIYDLVDRPDLKYPAFSPSLPARLARHSDLFKVIREQEILLHHPYESFAPVAEFLRQSATDPDVLAIKQTLYRTEHDSPIVDSLELAAQNGKEVTVVVELRARFDEAANIQLATRLQEAGAHVVYGVVGHKTHAKMLLVVRRELKKLRHYVHLSTGNYHSATAKSYTDYSLFTAEPTIGEDVRQVFLQLTSLGKVIKLGRLLQSPFSMASGFMERIEREIAHAQAGRAARIVVKVNSLVEPQIIQALYRASMAGVRVDLIVRGMCRLRPGVAGVSDNIRVRSIVGRFLEHARVCCFHNGGDSEVFLSSADWRERNFFRRVEIAFPIESKKLQRRLLKDLEAELADNAQAWELLAEGRYQRVPPQPDEPMIASQSRLLAELTENPG